MQILVANKYVPLVRGELVRFYVVASFVVCRRSAPHRSAPHRTATTSHRFGIVEVDKYIVTGGSEVVGPASGLDFFFFVPGHVGGFAAGLTGTAGRRAGAAGAAARGGSGNFACIGT